MRKGIKQSRGAKQLDEQILQTLARQGYKYVQIKGLTSDKRYDYLAPRFLLLIPLKELPEDPRERDIYEPIPSPLLDQWAQESDDHFKILIAHPS